jgi:tetratricopeptide (TPR) repeat protein
LAVENYKISLKENSTSSVRLLLARSQFLLKKYTESEGSYQESLKSRLSDYEKLKAHEGLGDVFMALKSYKKAKDSYSSLRNSKK